MNKAKEDFKDVITLNTWNQIDEIINDSKSNLECVEIDVTSMDKEKRTLIHKTVKKQYGNSVNSSTIDKDNKKLIKVTKFKGKG